MKRYLVSLTLNFEGEIDQILGDALRIHRYIEVDPRGTSPPGYLPDGTQDVLILGGIAPRPRPFAGVVIRRDKETGNFRFLPPSEADWASTICLAA